MSKRTPYTVQKRIRYDKLLILVAVFGVIGSIIIFRSYAMTRVNTTKNGTYSLDRFNITDSPREFTTIKGVKYLNLQSGDSASIELDTAKGMQYCVSGYNRTGATIKLTLDDSTITDIANYDLPINGSSQPTLLGCIKALNTTEENKMFVEVKGNNVWIKDLIVN